MIFPVKAEKLIPHRGEMAFLPHLTFLEGNTATSKFELTDTIFSVDKVVDPLYFIELSAQLAAAFNGYRAISNGYEPSLGYLASIGKADFFCIEKARVGSKITVKLEETAYVEPFSSVTCQIFNNDAEELAKFILKLWEEKGKTQTIKSNLGNLSYEHNHNIDKIYNEKTDIDKYIIKSISDLAKDGELTTFSCFFDNSFIGFDGHFNSNPILPGVVILKTIQMGIESSLNRKVKIKSLMRLKFSGKVRPNDIIEFSFKGNDILIISGKVEGNTVVSGRIKIEV